MKIYHLLNVPLLLILMIHMSVSNAQEHMDARGVISRSQDVMKLTGSESIITMHILNKQGKERIRKISSLAKFYRVEETEKRILVFLSPADVKGTGMLIFDYENKNDDLWLYMPALRKTRRIVSSEKSKSFMGSEFSNADIAVPNLDDYTYTLLGSELLDDTECWRIEARPKNTDIADAEGYSKKIVFIGVKDFVARRVLYYNFEGTEWKELNARNIQLLDEKSQKYQALEITMLNKLNGRMSIMKYDKIHFNPEIKDDCFTIRYLEKTG